MFVCLFVGLFVSFVFFYPCGCELVVHEVILAGTQNSGAGLSSLGFRTISAVARIAGSHTDRHALLRDLGNQMESTMGKFAASENM